MPITEASKAILMHTLKEWSKFATERERLTLVTNELTAITRRVVQECLAYLKSEKLDVLCDSPDDMKMLGVPLKIDPVIEEVFPNVKASVVLKCGASMRSILVNPNMTISAGGSVMPYDQFKKGIPLTFANNAAEFVSDSFLSVARTGGKEE